MIWTNLKNYSPEHDAAYAVSDGFYVGVGVWINGAWTSVHLDDDDMDLHNGEVNEDDFVWWAHLTVERFGIHAFDPLQAKMMNAEDDLKSKMIMMEQFGPDMLKDDDE